MNDRNTTARSRELGAELRRVRERDGRTAHAIARDLGWSPARLSRLESGKRGLPEMDIAMLLAVLGVRGEEFHRLLGIGRSVYDSSWLRSNRERLPHELSMLTLHETTATSISEYEPLIVPNLLRTADYARAVLHEAQLVPDATIDLRIQACLERQTIFRQRVPPTLTFFISEHVLSSPIGGPCVMNEQLLHLVLVSSRPDCTIRVLPASLGPGGLLGEPFRLMEYADAHPVVYAQNQTTSLFLEEPEDIDTYRTILRRLKELALDEAGTRELLHHQANSYDLPGESGR